MFPFIQFNPLLTHVPIHSVQATTHTQLTAFDMFSACELNQYGLTQIVLYNNIEYDIKNKN